MPQLALLLALFPQQYEALPPTPFDRVTSVTIAFAGSRRQGEAQSVPTQESEPPRPQPDLSVPRALIAQSRAARESGDFGTARVLAEEAVTDLLARPLAEQGTSWVNLLDAAGAAASAARDPRASLAAWSRVCEAVAVGKPDDHPQVQRARQNVATARFKIGDLAGARALFQKVHDIHARTLPEDDSKLQAARQNLAAVLATLGDIPAARTLFETVLDVSSRTLADDHPSLQNARQNLAVTMATQGDLRNARPLFEKVLEIQMRTLSGDHADVQQARQNLAITLYKLGDLSGARALFEQVLEVRSRSWPDDHPELQETRQTLATTLAELGNLEAARALHEKVLEINSNTLPDDHPALQQVRHDLARIVTKTLVRAFGLEATQDAARSLASEVARARCVELIGDVCSAQTHAAREAILESPGREAEERCSSLTLELDLCLAFALGYCVFGPQAELEAPAFRFTETTRGAAIVAAELTRRATRSEKHTVLRDALRAASDELAAIAQGGATTEEFHRARVKRESVERELVALSRELASVNDGPSCDVESLAAKLEQGEVAIGFRRFKNWCVAVEGALDSEGRRVVYEDSKTSLCAFVLRSSNDGAAHDAARPLTLVDLGPLEPIEVAAREWRDAIQVGVERGRAAADTAAGLVERRGERLRQLVLDPLLPAIGGAHRLVVALDDVLHLVPLDALPLEATALDVAARGKLVGDRWRIATRSTLTELLLDAPEPSGTTLVTLGGASYNVTPAELTADDVAATARSAPDGEAASGGDGQPTDVALLLRGSAWERGFVPLTHTAEEARGVVALYREVHDDERVALVLEKRNASRAGLIDLAPRARYLHIATHGWFAPESIRSWSDPGPIDKRTGLGSRWSGEEQVRGMSPMLLCGLALTGANLPEDATGRAPGLVTADELATLDLSNCELAVLSACDTNVGERRAGQGVASLQKALQMAGARSVITSLWKVPDEATKELMLDFYRRLWVEKKPKHQALWEAKRKLREAKDERGEPKYTTRDWAAWVLTGEPN